MNNELIATPGDRRKQFEKIVSAVLPYVGNSLPNIVLLQILTTLKLGGLVGEALSKDDTQLVQRIQEMVLATPEKREEALIVAQKFLG